MALFVDFIDSFVVIKRKNSNLFFISILISDDLLLKLLTTSNWYCKNFFTFVVDNLPCILLLKRGRRVASWIYLDLNASSSTIFCRYFLRNKWKKYVDLLFTCSCELFIKLLNQTSFILSIWIKNMIETIVSSI